ncbi:MAG: hypothetical protein ACOZQL_12540 [Myxococcota bacterium]
MLSTLVTLVTAAQVTLTPGPVDAPSFDSQASQRWLTRVTDLLQKGGRLQVVTAGAPAAGELRLSIARADTLLVSLTVQRTADGSKWVGTQGSVESEDKLEEWLDLASVELEAGLVGAALAQRREAETRWLRWMPGVAGLLSGAGAGVCLALSAGRAWQLRTGANLEPGRITTLAREGRELELAGLVLASVAGVGLATSVIWLGLPSKAGFALVPMSGGALFAATGSF